MLFSHWGVRYTYMYIIHHVKVTFFTLLVLLFKLLFYVNFHVINWFGCNFKRFRKTKGKLKRSHICEWFTFRSITCHFPRPPDVSLNWRMEKKPRITLVSRVPDGVLHSPAGRVSRQQWKFSVRKSTRDIACSVAFFDCGA